MILTPFIPFILIRKRNGNEYDENKSHEQFEIHFLTKTLQLL